MKVAAIDCGTNTIKLLIGALPDVEVRESRMIRLGEGVDETGQLSEGALGRARDAMAEFAEIIRVAGVDRVRFCATSATRDASNGAQFAADVQRILGMVPEVLSGDEEARLAYAGAIRGLGESVAEPRLVMDIGGGSTELILGTSTPIAEHSMNIGSVRLHERHHGDPQRIAADIEAALDECPIQPGDGAAVVGIAGTVTTIAAGVLQLAAYDRELIHGQRLRIDDVRAHIADLVAMTTEQRLALPWMHPGRADVIGAGALIVDAILARMTVDELLVSETDILDGIAWSLT